MLKRYKKVLFSCKAGNIWGVGKWFLEKQKQFFCLLLVVSKDWDFV